MAKAFLPFGDLFDSPISSGLTKPKAIRGAGVKFLNMGELFAHGRLGSINMDRVPISDREAQKYLLQKGDLLFGRRSLVLEGAGKCSIYLDDGEPTTFEGSILRVRLKPQLADPMFYYYLFSSQLGRAIIETIVEQTAVAGIRGSDLRALLVPCPPLQEQHAVASILEALDDKIEVNGRMSAALEAIARALFKSWFIDFDPVRARAEGRDTGLDPEIAALFSDSFEASELGGIPKSLLK